MYTHLKNSHSKYYSLLNRKTETDVSNPDCELNPKKRKVGPLDVAFHVPIKKASVKWNNVTGAITSFLVKSMVPIRTVEQESFIAMVKQLEPGYQVPSRKYFTETAIPKAYNDLVEKVKAQLKGAVHFSITSDAWTSAINMNPYVSVTLHFIDDDWKLISKNLSTIFAPEDHTGNCSLLSIISIVINV